MKWFRSLSVWIALPFVLLLVLIPLQAPVRLSAAPPTTTPPKSFITMGILLSHNHTADLYTLDVNSLSWQLIAHNIVATSPSWSPDHKHIAVAQTVDNGDLQIAILNSDGSNRHLLYKISHDRLADILLGIVRTISWSPDGNKIAFDVRLIDPRSASYIYIINIQGKLLEIVSTGKPWTFVSTWLPDNNELALLFHNGSCNAIYVYNTESEKYRFLIGCADFDEETFPIHATLAPCSLPHIGLDTGTFLDEGWSSNKQYLALALDQAGNCISDILVVMSDSGLSHGLPFMATTLAWSPDNNFISYIDMLDGLLCITNLNGSAPRCGPSMAQLDVTQMKWLPDNNIALMIDKGLYGPSQICLIAVDTFAQHCLTGVLPGRATIVDSW